MNYFFALQTIFVLLLLSGIIAFVGNYIGRLFGKKRLSIFGLRPRYTATAFTIFSGILIMAFTFFTLIFVSYDVRTAIFGLQKLRASINESKIELEQSRKELQENRLSIEDLNRELLMLKKEKKSLQKSKEALKAEVSDQRSKSIVFFADQAVYIKLVKGGLGKESAEKELKNALKTLDLDVKKYDISDVEVDRGDYNSTVSYIANTQGDIVLRIVSAKNVISGANLPVRLNVFFNKMIYSKDEEILRVDMSGKLSQAEIESKIKDLLLTAQFAAKNKGLMSNISGAYGSVPYSEIYNAAKKVSAYDTLVKLKIVAAKNIHIIGPLSVKLEVEL